MKIIAKYQHGSEDSLDKDIFYVVDEIPKSTKECGDFCSEDVTENRNLIVIKEGKVVEAYKGTTDEVNNSLFLTYKNHKQEYDLLVDGLVERDLALKTVRVTRCFLSHYSRTIYRPKIKNALKSYSWKERLEVLREINLKEFESKKMTDIEVKKVLAFQLCQILGLYENVEIYTKSEACKMFPDLRPYLYREKIDFSILQKRYDEFLDCIEKIEFIEEGELTYFCLFEKYCDIKNEKTLD